MEKESSYQIRNSVFISHATPADNEFTKWLSLKLIALGYNVWCDILYLEKGVDFWKRIENEIRNNTCKFLVVLSEISNERPGVLNEITVAEKVKKELKDDGYIIPLLIDEKLTHDKINIQLSRLNTIDFTKSWIAGLRDLDNSLKDNNVPKNENNHNASYEIYKNIILPDRTAIIKDEEYNSNWFSISTLPPFLYFHNISNANYDYLKLNFQYPYFIYKNLLCTFSEDIGYIFSNSELFESNSVIKIPTIEILNGEYNTDFAKNYECKKFMIRLLNTGLKNFMISKKLRQYYLSGKKTGFWFEKDQLVKDKINGELFVGKIKENNWHFGISCLIKLVPYPVLILSSHIFFTEDGKKLLISKPRQMKLRRKQGSNWWNNKWNDKLLNFTKYLITDDNKINIPVGKNENVIISPSCINFISYFSYNNPNNNTNEEITYEDFDDEEEGIST